MTLRVVAKEYKPELGARALQFVINRRVARGEPTRRSSGAKGGQAERIELSRVSVGFSHSR